jgi:hypothetical protein
MGHLSSNLDIELEVDGNVCEGIPDRHVLGLLDECHSMGHSFSLQVDCSVWWVSPLVWSISQRCVRVHVSQQHSDCCHGQSISLHNFQTDSAFISSHSPSSTWRPARSCCWVTYTHTQLSVRATIVSRISFENVERDIVTRWSSSHTREVLYTTTCYKTRNSPTKQSKKTLPLTDLDPIELEGPFQCE